MKRFFNGKTLGLCLALLVMCIFILPACGNDKNSKFLADYEKLVVKYEQAAQKAEGVTKEELEALQKESLDFATKSQELMQDNKNISADQIKQMQQLSERLMQAANNIKMKETPSE
ncbi:MAG: hypothetical protein LBJ14_03530 [Desulfarculales bacterium]|jgi:cytoplasmic iron level regulating protein YaaA (DUF328/UPF0246 family)|nr:hypothetical protein [Desulfarculales bacterium]